MRQIFNDPRGRLLNIQGCSLRAEQLLCVILQQLVGHPEVFLDQESASFDPSPLHKSLVLGSDKAGGVHE